MAGVAITVGASLAACPVVVLNLRNSQSEFEAASRQEASLKRFRETDDGSRKRNASDQKAVFPGNQPGVPRDQFNQNRAGANGLLFI